MEGFYLCAALAGLRSGVAHHQGLTNVEVAGFDDLTRTTEYFNSAQLDTMAEAGTWIVTQDPTSGQVYSRHQLTTGDYEDLNQREDSVTTNVDGMSYYMLELFSPYIGKSNVTPGFVDFLETMLRYGFETQKSLVGTVELGPRLISYSDLEIRQHEILRDRVVAQALLELPYPFNNFELHLVV